jgi:predicted TIM-barrel fold metal-dependent hydrolase
MGRYAAGDGPDQAPFQRVLEVAHDPRCWIKISGADRVSSAGAPYHDVEPFMRQLVEAAPDRAIWGSDWPHPHIKGPVPDENVLLALLKRVAPEPERLKAILVDNPARLYGFDA